jgi:hypothetical protein
MRPKAVIFNEQQKEKNTRKSLKKFPSLEKLFRIQGEKG